MDDGDYAVIPQTCPECGADLVCDIPVTLGPVHYEPDSRHECPRCHRTVILHLPGKPIRVQLRSI